ncbi:hypothetical protein JKP88DRAFT_251622 [Tribonema minus]|uniref:Uncharacterized protein n=1 Tax=Tribonema minus TaxID=303371 RepID=A0A836CMY0_9STRA|nr:hypothetical protein JKP88DRAFT_251622 [Tribonema minus]
MPIVLVFEDVQPMTFPYSTSLATDVINTYGPVFAKDVVTNHSIIIVNKVDNAPCTASSFAFSRSSSGSVDEIARNNFTVDAANTKATYSVGCLRVDPVSNTRTIENVLEADHESTIITTTSSADTTKENSTSLTFDGIQFSTDDACIMFGANQEFRIRYGKSEASNGANLLVMEAKNTLTGQYDVKTSISDA